MTSVSEIDVVDRSRCPQCGAPLPLGRGGGTAACGFCGLTSSYQVVPSQLGAPGQLDTLAGIVIVPLHASRDARIVGWHGDALEACDPRTGESKWRVAIARTHRPLSSAFERVFVATDAGELVAIDSVSGRVAFAAPLPSPARAIADALGPAREQSRVVVCCEAGELVALDRMSGRVVAQWSRLPAPPRIWATGGDRLIVAMTSSEVWLLDPMREQPLARIAVEADAAWIAGGLAFLGCRGGEHVAVELADGRIAWRGQARWDPATGLRAAFGRELFVAAGTQVSIVPGGATTTTPAPIEELGLIAGTLVARTHQALAGYQRTLAPAWSIPLAELQNVRIADNARMLVIALERDGHLWLRGVLPTSGAVRWNTLVADAGLLVGHAVIGDLVLVDAGYRYVLRADTGQVMWRTPS